MMVTQTAPQSVRSAAESWLLAPGTQKSSLAPGQSFGTGVHVLLQLGR